jgi:DNA ligase-1
MAIRKPMKAEDFVEEELTFPKMGSYKVDGYRSFIEEGICRMSSGKPMPNDQTRTYFSDQRLEGLDGEMVAGQWNKPDTFRKTSSALRKQSGEPNAILYCFDDRSVHNLPYEQRERSMEQRVMTLRDLGFKQLAYLRHVMLRDLQDMAQFEYEALANGFEGIMLNDPTAPYKFGRSTVKEGIILKVKRMKHAEARIVGYTEQMENTNEAFEDDLGRSKRSEAKDGLLPTGMVGSFIVESSEWPRPFSISATSLTHPERVDAFVNFESKYKGELARYKFFPKGIVDVPRHGIFEGLRDADDL